MKKNEVHVFQGMSRDVHPKKQQQQFFWDAMNIRLTAINDDTLLTVTNERGPVKGVGDDGSEQVIPGKYLGHATVGNTCVVFSVKKVWNETKNEYENISYITQIEILSNADVLYNNNVNSSLVSFNEDSQDYLPITPVITETSSSIPAYAPHNVLASDNSNYQWWYIYFTNTQHSFWTLPINSAGKRVYGVECIGGTFDVIYGGELTPYSCKSSFEFDCLCVHPATPGGSIGFALLYEGYPLSLQHIIKLVKTDSYYSDLIQFDKYFASIDFSVGSKAYMYLYDRALERLRQKYSEDGDVYSLSLTIITDTFRSSFNLTERRNLKAVYSFKDHCWRFTDKPVYWEEYPDSSTPDIPDIPDPDIPDTQTCTIALDIVNGTADEPALIEVEKGETAVWHVHPDAGYLLPTTVKNGSINGNVVISIPAYSDIVVKVTCVAEGEDPNYPDYPDEPDEPSIPSEASLLVMQLVASTELNFNENYPIEAIAVYGSENLSKVYWTDGLNQPRVIKIGSQINSYKIINEHTFDFVPWMQLKEKVTVTRNATGGIFPAGVVQYAFTYYNKYAQETNIFHTTPLQYTSFDERGGSPEDKTSNSFSILIENIDPQFDYLRIYSIVRTTKDAEAIVTKVADIEIKNKRKGPNNQWTADDISFVDIGTIGNIIDPDFLLYVGGEAVTASTITHKDNVLFLGDLQLLREEEIENELTNTPNNIEKFRHEHIIRCDSQLSQQGSANAGIIWYNTLKDGYCAGFKYGEYYKLGIQFQHKTGKWSKPIFVKNEQQTLQPAYSKVTGQDALKMEIPGFRWRPDNTLLNKVRDKDYVKARGVVVFPSLYNRRMIAQGILNGTVYNDADRNSAMPYAQSSWFFRPFNVEFQHSDTSTHVNVEYRHNTMLGMAPNRFAEIQGAEAVDLTNLDVDQRIKFKVDLNVVTFHSPDVEFDNSFYNFDYSPSYKLRNAGFVEWYKCYSDIDIQTETAKFDDKGGGFIRGINSESNGEIICSGLFYSDYLVSWNSRDKKYAAIENENVPVLFMTFPWNNVGSINNDINRSVEDGTRSAILKTKKLSNLRIGRTIFRDFNAFTPTNNPPDYVALERHDVTWQTLKTLTTETTQGSTQDTDVYVKFFNIDYVGMCKIKTNKGYYGNIDTLLTPAADYGKYFSNNNTTYSDITEYLKPTFAADINTIHSTKDLITQGASGEEYISLGDKNRLYKTQDAVRMKYKSTPHLVIDLKNKYLIERYDDRGGIDPFQREDLQLIADLVNESASFKNEGYNGQDVWYPAGPAVSISNLMAETEKVQWIWGDTWYQRYDCMKTYAYTLEDQNSVIEIGSFPVETRVNIDGRYDINRGQLSNIVAMPTNFNLINKVYSQLDNFFSYTVLDPDMYKNTRFNNQITWTLGHQVTADVDEWSRITLASLYEMDGTKGPITRLYTFNDQVVCFQQDAISQVLYDERVALSASDGNPIELANSASFQGTRYFSDSIGCANKWSICKSPSALYFLDTRQNNLCTLSNEGVQYLSRQKGFGYYLSADGNKQDWKCFYDSKYNDLYVLGNSDCLVYSEMLGTFTSFMDYNNTATLFNIGSELYAIKSINGKDENIWRMFHGEYNNFFGNYRPFYFTFISNDEPLSGKFFTNIQVNADLYQNGVILNNRLFDYISVSDEYQSANNVALDFRLCKPSSLKKKFRLWNINIPRHGKDRIANTWCRIQLGVRGTTEAEKNALKNLKFVMHDLNVTYYI